MTCRPTLRTKLLRARSALRAITRMNPRLTVQQRLELAVALAEAGRRFSR